MSKITFLFTARYLFSSKYEHAISTVMYICFFSIAIGAMSLTMVTAIMRGFEHAIHEKLQGIHADAVIQSYEHELNQDAIASVVSKEFPAVIGMSPIYSGHAVIQPNHDQEPTVVCINGIEPIKESSVSSIDKKLFAPQTLTEAVHEDHIAIGKTIAHHYELHVGSPVTLFYLEDLSKNSPSLHKTTAIVGGIFETGIDEYDSNVILTSPNYFKTLFPHKGIMQIKLKINPDLKSEAVIADLHQRLMLDVYSWKELYPALVSALKLEKYAMFFILLLITIVASMTIIALLFMLIQSKRTDIAILYAMGAPIQLIRRIFITISLIITTSATLCGLLLATILCAILKKYPFISLPDSYYVSYLPVHLEWSTLILIFATITMIAILATLLPIHRIQVHKTAQLLRFEG